MHQKKLMLKGLLVFALLMTLIVLYVNTLERGSAFEFGPLLP